MSPALPAPRDPARPYHVCFVCLGNICRSPSAEVVARAQLAKAGLDHSVVVDSAGTGDWHLGDRMNSAAAQALARRGYDGSAHRARQFDPSWQPDLVVAMDKSNVKNLNSMYGTAGGDLGRIRLFGDLTGLHGAEVPDPYGGPDRDFDQVLDLLESAMPALIARLAAVAA